MTLLFNRIRQSRRTAAMSQSELAAIVGVARSAVAQWERQDGARPTTAWNSVAPSDQTSLAVVATDPDATSGAR